MGAPHHGTAEHKRLAAQAVAQANANPDYLCPRCGQPGGPWEGGHPDDEHGDPIHDAPYRQAEHRHCNAKHGLAYGQRRKTQRTLPTSFD